MNARGLSGADAVGIRTISRTSSNVSSSARDRERGARICKGGDGSNAAKWVLGAGEEGRLLKVSKLRNTGDHGQKNWVKLALEVKSGLLVEQNWATSFVPYSF